MSTPSDFLKRKIAFPDELRKQIDRAPRGDDFRADLMRLEVSAAEAAAIARELVEVDYLVALIVDVGEFVVPHDVERLRDAVGRLSTALQLLFARVERRP